MMYHTTRAVMSFADGSPTAWFGHGLGAIVAYEALRRVTNSDTPNRPVLLWASGCPAPQEFKKVVKETWLKEDPFTLLEGITKPQQVGKLNKRQVKKFKEHFGVPTGFGMNGCIDPYLWASIL